MSPRTDVVVVGGGAIGLGVAHRLAAGGLGVVVCDPSPGQAASHASAGMLAPVLEVHYGEDDLLALNLASADRWPAFAAEVTAAAGQDAGFRACGSLVVAFDGDDKAELDRLAGYHARLGLDSEPLSGTACRELEPALSPRVRGGIRVAGDHQADNRQLCRALLAALGDRGVVVERAAVARLDHDGTAVRGVTLDDGRTVTADRVVLAAGAWSAGIDGLPDDARPPVRPVKGQILRLAGSADDPVVGGNVRALVRGTSLYVVPRVDGRIVIGATQEEMGFDRTVTAEGVEHLLRYALEVLPALNVLELVETGVGLRPGTPDNRPVIGPTSVEGLIVATGHFRNGILLTPITVDAVAGLLGVGPPVPEVAPFGLERFAVEEVAG